MSKRKSVTIEELKGLVGKADSKSDARKHNDVWKTGSKDEVKGGEETKETLGPSSSSIKGPAPRK